MANRTPFDDYTGDDPSRLAEAIEAALKSHGRGHDRRMLRELKFFEGELRLILRGLRMLEFAEETKRRLLRREEPAPPASCD